MSTNPFIHVRSPKLRLMPGEQDEHVNDGIYRKAFALYLQKMLAARGYVAPAVVCEDWGWWVTIGGLGFSCGIGVYGMQIDQTDELDLCATVLASRRKRWSFRHLSWMDPSAEIDRLHGLIREVCDSDPEITVVAETEDFPLR